MRSRRRPTRLFDHGTPSSLSLRYRSYTTGAIEPDGSLLEGTVTFDVFAESIVEQPVAATPEPSMLALAGLAMLLLWRGAKPLEARK